MAITWTAKKIDNGVEQIKFKVKSDSKSIGLMGTVPLNDDETATEPLVDWLKAKLGSKLVSEFETTAENIDDTPPTLPS
tara:strand:+ start:870 stop:1106 length:237 start_codon:yes stop_codon:yes gene_type:complete